MRSSFYTDRLTLSTLTLNEAAFILELVNTKGWLSFIGDRNIKTIDAAKEYIQKITENPYVNYWLVTLKEERTPLGIITFIKRDYLTHYDIGFAFLPEHSKKGYAYEATKAVLDVVIKDPFYTHILATTVKENNSSIKLLEKLGLKFESESTKDNETLLLYTMPTEKFFLDGLTRSFFDVFTNTNSSLPKCENIYELCISETILVRKNDLSEEIYNLKTFVDSRKKMLTDGTLTEFEEREIAETTLIIGNMAERISKFAKKGVLNGKPFEDVGNKLFQFIKTKSGWKINSVIWEDEKK